MINKRELKISAFYSTLIAIMIFTIWILGITGFLHKGSGTMFNILTGILMAFLFLAPIVCISIVIYHLVKAFRFYKKVKNKEHYIFWEYDKRLWRKFIGLYFSINIADDLKSFGKFGISFFSISLLAIAITIAINAKRNEYAWVYIFIPFVIFIIYFSWVMGRNVLKALDHMIFSDYKVTLMERGVILNGEFIDWGDSYENKLLKKKIEDGYIEIKYKVRARSAGRFANRYSLSITDSRRLKIPIPKEKYKEAEIFINIMK